VYWSDVATETHKLAIEHNIRKAIEEREIAQGRRPRTYKSRRDPSFRVPLIPPVTFKGRSLDIIDINTVRRENRVEELTREQVVEILQRPIYIAMDDIMQVVMDLHRERLDRLLPVGLEPAQPEPERKEGRALDMTVSAQPVAELPPIFRREIDL